MSQLQKYQMCGFVTQINQPPLAVLRERNEPLTSLPKALPYPMPRTGGGMGTLAARIHPPYE